MPSFLSVFPFGNNLTDNSSIAIICSQRSNLGPRDAHEKSKKTSQNFVGLMLLVNTAEDGERTGLLFLKDALRV